MKKKKKWFLQKMVVTTLSRWPHEYLDFYKAFDKVPHRRLLIKLQGYGIKGKLFEWIKDFIV